MAKSKKKKNYKLRRRVKRTIAALTMIMAIVVAAIPVENYGSMQAAEDGISLLSVDTDFGMEEGDEPDGKDHPYTKDTGNNSHSSYWTNKYLYEKSIYPDEEKKYTDHSDEKEFAQQVIGTNVVDAYKIATDEAAKKAIVSGSGDENDIKVNSYEYYGYVMFKADDLMEKLDNAVFRSNTNLEFTFSDDTTNPTPSLSGGSYDTGTKDANDDPVILSLDSISGIKRLNDTVDNISTSLSDLDATWSREYEKVLSSSLAWNDILDQYEKTAFDAAKAKVKAYNDKIVELEKIQDKLGKNPEQVLSKEEVDRWNSYKDSLEEEYENAQKLSFEKTNLSSANGLPLIYVHILNKCYGKSSSENLDGYNFIRGTYGNTGVYLVQHKSDKDSDVLDANGYLTSGRYTMVGVKSEAFQSTETVKQTITGITLPDTIEFIGESAFEGCASLRTADIDARGCFIIGDNAFADSGLTTLTFSNAADQSRINTFGVRAFANTPLNGVQGGLVIPATVTTIGAGCFEKSNITGVTFSPRGQTVEIGEYAFFDCVDLEKVTFAEDREYDIKKGAFAGGNRCKTGAKLAEFAFPEGNMSIGADYILAGRADLKSVTFGKSLQGTIPTNTLRGCFRLEEAHFNSPTATYDTYVNGEVVDPQLFSDVTNEAFIVYGPQYMTDSVSAAKPRECSWNGFLGYQVDGKFAPVPYCYVDASGATHIELGYDGGQYVARVDVDPDSQEPVATLSNYRTNPLMPEPTTRTAVTIPARVGRYRIVEIGDNCFEGPVKEKVYRITIEDGHLVSIGSGAFSGCENLEWVYIGNSVRSIAANAFSNCPALENVEFSTLGKIDYKFGQIDYIIGDDDETWQRDITIDDTAFNTQSERLTFHGAIHKGYRPFEIAMGANNSSLLKSDRQVCYRADEPLNLTVIRNRQDGKATLVDYPHYQEIDDINREYIRENHPEVGDSYSITGEFERNYVQSATGLEEGMEKSIVDATLNIELPSGIESINTHDDGDVASVDGFYDGQSKNNDDYSYVKQHYVLVKDNVDRTSGFSSNRIYKLEDIETGIRSNGGSSKDITKLYSEDGYIEDSQYAADYALPSEDKVAHGGLFSGYFNDNNKEVPSRMVQQYALNGGSSGLIDNTYNSHTYEENYNSGNDYLTHVKTSTVESLPDYVFDNCENLLTADFTNSLSEMGALPFRGCKNIYSVNVGAGNQNFLVQNMMIFAANGDGKTYTMKECLEGRGKGDVYGSAVIAAEEFPEVVTELEERAFANCEELSAVDMTNTSVISIPVDAFRNDKKLHDVKLPNTIRRVETGAFVGVSDTLFLTVPTSDCVITADAIDGKSDVTIIGSKYKTDGETLSDLYHSYETLVKNYGEDQVHFSDYGNSYHIDFVDRDLRSISGYSYVIEIKEEDKPYNLNAQQIPPSAPEVDGYDFITWMCKLNNGEVLTGKQVGDRAFNNINEDRLYFPSYEANPTKVVSDGKTYKFNFENATATLVSGSATIAVGTQLKSGDAVEGGSTISLIANDQNRFQYWSAANGDTSYNDMFSGNINNYIITFTMPNSDVTVTAHMNGSGGTNDPNNPDDPNATRYTVTVRNGTGSGQYAAGATVTITANTPNPGASFVNWTTENTG
ncbi:MAG: leucine-rich repeat protein, partial [Lachnospiraceae bacterium]|nr:leucine-rich repeat protein [Lachnospiraceae bacterium]